MNWAEYAPSTALLSRASIQSLAFQLARLPVTLTEFLDVPLTLPREYKEWVNRFS